MPDYRRDRVRGGTFFFTVDLLDRRSTLLVSPIDALRAAVRQVRVRAPFHIDAWVVLPDQMHCLWTLPHGDCDFPGRWRAIKTALSKALPIGEWRSPVMTSRGKRGIWQRRYWEHTIRDDQDFAAHMDCTHFNTVKHGLVEHPMDWPHSSFRRCVRSGLYPAAWIGPGASRKRPASGRKGSGMPPGRPPWRAALGLRPTGDDGYGKRHSAAMTSVKPIVLPIPGTSIMQMPARTPACAANSERRILLLGRRERP
jgi:putative transposase